MVIVWESKMRRKSLPINWKTYKGLYCTMKINFFSSFMWLSSLFFFSFFFLSIEQWKKFCPWKPCWERLPTKRFEKFVIRNFFTEGSVWPNGNWDAGLEMWYSCGQVPLWPSAVVFPGGLRYCACTKPTDQPPANWDSLTREDHFFVNHWVNSVIDLFR